jgi:hypothetical protein
LPARAHRGESLGDVLRRRRTGRSCARLERHDFIRAFDQRECALPASQQEQEKRT